MLMAVLVIVSLWIVAGAVVLTATRKPAEVIDLVLANEAPVSKITTLKSYEAYEEPIAA